MTSSTTAATGQSVIRTDLRDKLTGQAKYTADLKLPGMLHALVLRSPHPHANILSVDTQAAARLPGVYAIVTPFDVPPGKVAPDLAILDRRVRFVGDEVAAVAAADLDIARQALSLLEVEYQALPFVLEPEDALKPGAIVIHPEGNPGGNLVGGKPLSLERGSVAEGFAQAELVLEEEYFIPVHSATALEPRAALAAWEGDSLTVWKSSRGVHVDRATLAEALGIPPAKVRVVGPYLGAGFGNKDESRLGALAAVLAQRAGRPVRLEYSRQDEFVAGRTRHAARIRIKAGFKRDGSITAIHTIATLNKGAYLASGPGVARRLGQGSLYLYHCANSKYEAYLVYTNRPTGGSYRALGAPQGHFALETLMDRAAEALGIDPLEFRLKNQVRAEGQPGRRTTPPGQNIDSQPLEGGVPFSSNGLDQCLRLGAQAFGWGEPAEQPADPAKKRGRGMSMMIYRGGPGFASAAEVRIDRSGVISLVCGLMDVGEGATTVLAQMAAQGLGLDSRDIRLIFADSATTPNAPITAGSTATFSTGTAVVQAATSLRGQLLELAADGLEAPVDNLELSGGAVYVKGDPARRMSLAEVVRRAASDVLSASASVNPGSPNHIINSFGAHFAQVEVDTGTGQVRVLRYVAAHDSGRILNPRLALNQVEGGISQMLGFALSEELVTDGPTGITLNGSYLEHKCPTILDYPDIQIIFADVVDPIGPLGAKALGEVPAVGVAPAIANAIYDAIGVRFTRLPITPQRVLEALSLQRSAVSPPTTRSNRGGGLIADG
ncbi:MAG: xanthine dehydrogenase family protein molybdopterin-binding subunit [Dehalococcoidia bacterium]|nr:xanthine dehydrogenase family protein molybdopterin-binding subunit [Dehalococcoidia bacterium]MSQ16675.1 xanthine dehydrogenase family protein molybdopterin-binding subunit [Dehalococcoidia bacterium]